MNDYIGDNIKVVLFDHDDTLVGTFSPKSKLHKLVARTYYGKELSDEEIIANWGKPLPELVGILYGTIDADKALENNAKHHTDFPKELFEPTIPVLRHIKSNGKKIGIITATSRFSFEHDLDLHNIPRELIDYTQAAAKREADLALECLKDFPVNTATTALHALCEYSLARQT